MKNFIISAVVVLLFIGCKSGYPEQEIRYFDKEFETLAAEIGIVVEFYDFAS